MIPIAIVMLFLGSVILLAERVNQRVTGDAELTRKVVHIGAGNVILIAWWFQLPAWIGISASIMAVIMALLSYFVPILPSINSVGRKSLGTFFYAVSIGVLIACFFPEQPQYAAIGILVMAWGDGMAALIGQNWGTHTYQLLGTRKSWEGSFTMTSISYLICFVILLITANNLWQSSIIALVVAIVATGLEAISKLGVDNLTVPLISGGLSFLLIQVF